MHFHDSASINSGQGIHDVATMRKLTRMLYHMLKTSQHWRWERKKSNSTATLQRVLRENVTGRSFGSRQDTALAPQETAGGLHWEQFCSHPLG
jgi:hypothetical protein